MRKNRIIQIATGTLLLLTTIAGGATLAWLHPTTKVGNQGETNTLPIDGSSSSGYFAYGDGSAEHPYGIRIPRHLYNLAWLQYLGAFQNRQLYFELAGNVDMSGWTLPPIGTEDNPFVSQFNGQGYVVSNLTVSNTFTEYNVHPATITGFDTTNKQPHILGMFGVVGNYNNLPAASYSSAVNTLSDMGIYNAKIKTAVSDTLVGIAAGYVDATMSNVVVDSSTINVASSTSTAYKKSGATNPITNNISDFSLVGYTTKATSIRQDEQSVYDINTVSNITFNANEQNDAQGWGGSINMKTIYHRIIALRKHRSQNIENTFNWYENKLYYENQLDKTTYNNTIYREEGRTPHYQRVAGSNISGHEYIGNYNVFIRDTTFQGTGATTDQSYLYLGGGHVENREYRTRYSHSGRYITDGTNYLCFDGTSFYNTTNSSEATLWHFSNTSGTAVISTEFNDQTYYLYNNSGTLSGRTNSSTTWTLTISGNTLKITNGAYKLICHSGEWILSNGSAVPFYVLTQNNRYMTTANSGSTPGYTQNINNASHWYVEDGTNYIYYFNGSTKMYLAIYYTYSIDSYYGYYYIDDQVINLRVIDNSSEPSYNYFTYNNGTPVAVVPIANVNWRGNVTTTNTNYYFRYNNGFTYTTDTNNRGTYIQGGTDSVDNFDDLYISNVLNSDEITKKGPDSYQTPEDVTNSSLKTYYTAEDTTYFPLNVEKDVDTYITNASTLTSKINANDLDPKDSNTGYIIAGSSYTPNLTNGYEYNSSQTSNVRISEYPSTSGDNNISGSFRTSYNTLSKFEDSGIYTLNASGTRQTMADAYTETKFPRYLESKESFYKNSLTTGYNQSTQTYTCTNNVYGLHFMASSISKDSIVNAANVSVLGNQCDSYQFPVNSVDFNLKQKGVINFFAGTYFPGNDSFFSLHEVIRNNDAVKKVNGSGEPIDGQYTSFNTISDIKEIEEIFSNDQGTKTTKYSNIYKYKGKTGNSMYSVPYRIDGKQNKYVMNKNNTEDTETLYTYATMGQSDFEAYCNTYGYTSRLKTSQIGVNSLTSNSIYYFEFPMNPGEYCLGSVEGGTGAYLLYLDIGANASKTQRTVFYEHFVFSEKTFTYPHGVALQELSQPSQQQSSTAIITTDIDVTDSVCVSIVPGSTGTILVDRVSNSVALTRAQSMNAPPIYAGDSIISVYDSSDPSTPIEVTGEVKTTDVKRMQYYDYNVNLETLTITTFTDTLADGASEYVRTIKQSHYSSNVQEGTPSYEYNYDSSNSIDQRSDMKIYNSDGGTRYSSEDLIDQDILSIGDASSNIALTIRLDLSGTDVSYTGDISFNAVIDLNNEEGTYYIFDNYVIEIVPSGSSIVVKVLAIDKSGTANEIYLGETELDTVNQTITVEVP